MGFQMSEFEFQTFLFFFWPPPPLLGKKAEIFPFFNYDASPYIIVFLWLDKFNETFIQSLSNALSFTIFEIKALGEWRKSFTESSLVFE